MNRTDIAITLYKQSSLTVASTVSKDTLTLSEMLTFEEISELESSDSGETKHMEEYLETFDTSLQSETPYSDVTQVSKKKWKN